MKLRKINKNKKGFTLVELIVVIAILLIISVLAVVGFGQIIDNARLSATTADANRLAGQLNLYNAFQPADVRRTEDDQITDAEDGDGSGRFNLEISDPMEANFSISIDQSRRDDVLAMLCYDSSLEMWVVVGPDEDCAAGEGGGGN